MKFVKFLFALLIVVGATQVQAQSKLKIGHIDQQRIVDLMPAYDSVKVKLANLEQSYKDEHTALQSYAEEQQIKYLEYKDRPDAQAIVISQMEDELTELLEKLNAFWQEKNLEYQQQLQTYQQPIIEEIEAAINAVAEEHGYTYIVEKSLFHFADDSHDVTALVLKKLGIEDTGDAKDE